MRPALLLACCAGSALALLPARPAVAQAGRPPALVLKTNVFQPLARGYHLELEKNWRRQPRYSLGLTLQGYYGAVTQLTTRRDLTPGERVRGYGLELMPRLYLPGRHPELLTGFYLAAGPHVQRFRLHFQDKGWVQELNEDALPVYAYVPVDYVETITRYGAAAVVGYQGPLELGPLFLDFYLGLGWRAVHSRSALPESRYRTSRLDYGAGGVYFPIGFKLGARL